MKKINVTCGFVLGMMLFSSCISNVSLSDMSMKSNATSKILNLKLVGGEVANPDYYSYNYKKIAAGSNIALLDMETKLVEDYFDKTKSQYGYAVLEYESDMNQGAMLFWGISLVVVPLYLLGFPTDSADFKLKASFSIYDSNGNLVKKYSAEDKFYQVAGIYYGKNPTKKAQKRFSVLFTKLFETAATESYVINQALLGVGPITSEKDSVAIAKILGDFTQKTTSSPTYYSYPTSSSQDKKLESIKNIANSLEEGMKEFNEKLMNDLKNRPCGSCRGNGNCSNCGGTGKFSSNECYVCHGSGVCKRCNGTGKA